MDVRAEYFEAYRRGMPLDSLYFLLAREALLGLSFDTAMAFNLSIPTPPPGAFRDSLLRQRYRLYVLSGLNEDAARIKDSLPPMAAPRPPGRRPQWELRFLSGFAGEEQTDARSYPSGLSIAGLDTGGWQARTRGGIDIPLPSPEAVPLALGLGYDAAKSYYKDSLDYRGVLRLRADRILDRFSAGITAEAGRITGLGPVAALKGDLTYLAVDGGGFWLANAGYESEWEHFRDRRYAAAWATAYREWDLGGAALQGAVSASYLRQDPLRIPGMANVMYVSDVTQSRPTHYQDASFRDSVPWNPITRQAQYLAYADTLEFRVPQDAVTLRPTLGFAVPAGWGMRAECTGIYAFTLYPGRSAWREERGSEQAPGDSVEYRGYALNRADGRYYRAYIDQRSGGFDELYGETPLLERRVLRMDHRVGAEMSWKRPSARWGSLALDFTVERTFSNLSGEAPVWIPEWEYGASLRWTKTGSWR